MKNKSAHLYWLLILAIVLLPLFYLGNNPGLYLDAITPDYAAVQILYPSDHSVNWFVAFPILCAMYHGCVNVLISLITVGISGHASVIQHHITNGIIIFIILLLLDYLLQKHNVSKRIRRLGLFVVASLPTLMTFCLTQYYIELPGCIFLLVATILYEKYFSSANSTIFTLSACFFFLGLAFYSYFNFLFFLPGFLILVLMQTKTLSSKIDHLLIAIYSFACGAILYFIGYCMIFLKKINHSSMTIPCGILIFILIYGASAIVLFSYSKGKRLVPYIITEILLLIAFAALIYIAPSFLTIYSNLGVMGEATTFLNRFSILFHIIYETITGVSAEKLIYGEIITRHQGLYVVLLPIIAIIFIALSVIKRTAIKTNHALQYLLVLLLYCICCVPFITHMHTQHFVPVAFWSMLIFLLCVDSLEQYFSKLSRKIIPIVFGLLIMFNCYNVATVVQHIKVTGGTGLYTNQINVLAEEALEKADSGYKEAYLFPEWGFLCGFDYLTRNQIAFSDTADTATVQAFLAEGYTVQILYWNYGNTDKYLAILDGMDASIELKEYSLKNGEGVAFIRMQVTK